MVHQQTMHWTNEEWNLISEIAKNRNQSPSRTIKNILKNYLHPHELPTDKPHEDEDIEIED